MLLLLAKPLRKSGHLPRSVFHLSVSKVCWPYLVVSPDLRLVEIHNRHPFELASLRQRPFVTQDAVCFAKLCDSLWADYRAWDICLEVVECLGRRRSGYCSGCRDQQQLFWLDELWLSTSFEHRFSTAWLWSYHVLIISFQVGDAPSPIPHRRRQKYHVDFPWIWNKRQLRDMF